MTALYTALLEGESKASLVLMVIELREENARLREGNEKLCHDLNSYINLASDLMTKETP